MSYTRKRSRSPQDLERKHPQSFQVLRLRAYLASDDGNSAEAMQFFRRANQARPLQPDVVVPVMRLLLEAKLAGGAEELGSAMLARDKSVDGVMTFFMGRGSPPETWEQPKKFCSNAFRTIRRIQVQS